MTPFGRRMREMRAARGVTQKQMAAAIGVTPAYLSALERGHRGVPNYAMIQRILGYFNVIWDEADELAELARSSHPRVVVDTAGLGPRATELANRLAVGIAGLNDEQLGQLCDLLEAMLSPREGSAGSE
ncbi:MAG: helix-turn-helix domain-containing protein [Notoacmeibacter sp.]|nr:helix-turn-helix domain-containing protein [Notoacmeibacter sp.]